MKELGSNSSQDVGCACLARKYGPGHFLRTFTLEASFDPQSTRQSPLSPIRPCRTPTLSIAKAPTATCTHCDRTHGHRTHAVALHRRGKQRGTRPRRDRRAIPTLHRGRNCTAQNPVPLRCGNPSSLAVIWVRFRTSVVRPPALHPPLQFVNDTCKGHK